MFLHKYGKLPGDSTFILDDTTIIYTGHRYQKLRYFDSLHIHQAQLIKEQLNKCNLPFVFCADLNSVPSTYVYHHISQGLNDAFVQNGSGWSATYSDLSPTLRIDVTLMSKELNTTQFYCPKLKNASDHYPLVTDIIVK
jgi:endonuclease/exonuclease/phosphatase family metal-dependent hydrolase